MTAQNGKDVLLKHVSPQLAGESISYVESDPPLVPKMIPVADESDSDHVQRLHWAGQPMHCSREVRYYYLCHPRIVQIEYQMLIGFPHHVPGAEYGAVWMMDAGTTEYVTGAMMAEPKRFVGGDQYQVVWMVQFQFHDGRLPGFLNDLQSKGSFRYDVGGSWKVAVISQQGINHVVETMTKANIDLGYYRSTGAVASQA